MPETFKILNAMVLFFLISLAVTIVIYMDFSGNNFYISDDKKTLEKFEKRLSKIPFIINCVVIILLIIFFVALIILNNLTPILIFLPSAFLAIVSASAFPPFEILAIVFALKHYKHDQNAKSKKHIIFASISLLFSTLFLVWFFVVLSQ